ncbi:MAG: helix-turn-helix transcriptional regulator [Clostridiales bacterium]|nr:helix-turn-helix transcriptional regulator [Clostridiales bacterium]
MNFKYTKLKKARKPLSTQAKFSDLIDVSEEHYVKIENGYSNPSVPVLLKICETVNIPAQYFFTSGESFLTQEQIDILMDYSDKHLKTILNVLKDLYEGIA